MIRNVEPKTASWTVVAVAWFVAGVALLVQQLLEPFLAGSHMGLFTNGGDLDVYRRGAWQILRGQRLYAAQVPGGGWFTYPPFAAVTFIPLALLGFTAAKTLWMLVSFAALVVTVWRCATVLGYRPDRRLGLLAAALAVVALDVEAVRGTLWQGQVNLVLMAIIVWDLTRPSGSRMRGWPVGMAAGIKLTAIVFLPYLVCTRQWRAAAIAAITAAATLAITWIVLPVDSTDYWLHAVVHTEHIGPLTHPGNYSLAGILATLWAPDPMPVQWWLLSVAAAGVLGFYSAYVADRSGHRLLGIAVVGLLSCTVTPLAWGHHWVWTVPLLAVTLDRIARSRGPSRWAWVANTLAIYCIAFMWFNAWLYRTSRHLSAHYPTYVAALDAAIAEMTTTDKMLTVANHPVLFIAVSITTLACLGRKPHRTQTSSGRRDGRLRRSRLAVCPGRNR